MTDEELVSLVKLGDKEKFGLLMERYSPKLFRYGRKFLSGAGKDGDDGVRAIFVTTELRAGILLQEGDRIYAAGRGTNHQRRYSSLWHKKNTRWR